MTATNSFFLPKSSAEHFLYGQIRDDLRRHKSKTQIESFWGKYRKHKSRNFLREAQVNFYQRWWEMFLAVGLLNLNFDIKTDKDDKGPDIKVILPSNKVVWIEAVAPNIGRTDDSVPPIMDVFSSLPEREFLLRLNVALCDKLDVFKGYLNKGVIKEDDYCIIALSSCALAQYGDLMDFPVSAPLKVLAGCGQLVLSKNGNYVGRRNHIQTSSPGREREVDTCLFDREDFSIISAVLYSHTDILNSPNNPESSFQLSLNPLKVNPDVKSAFGNMEIWFQGSKNGDETIWTKE